MSDVVQVAIIAAGPATVIGLLNAGVSLWTNRRVAIVHDAVNGAKELLEAKLAAALAEIQMLKRERDDLRSGND